MTEFISFDWLSRAAFWTGLVVWSRPLDIERKTP